MPGTLSDIAGIENANDGSNGCAIWRAFNNCLMVVVVRNGVNNRGRKEESIDRVVTCAVAILRTCYGGRETVWWSKK